MNKMASLRVDHSIAQPTAAPAAAPVPSSSQFASSSRFPPPSQLNTSSVSLVSTSTAQGRPIPLSDANAADRTTALRELSRSQPIARRPYTETTGPGPAPPPPPSTAGTTTGTTTGTYSQPVLVRTYSGPIASPARAQSTSRRDAISGVKGRPKAPSSNQSRRPRRFGVTLIRPLVSQKQSPGDDVRLPPLEAFSFKSIMADIEHDIGADLDRIADICARSRYSLSNQYEIHVAPHGSGASFIQGGAASASTTSPPRDNGGPTLQAISIDEEDGSTNQARRATVRRRSAAYGTLETIISSSRSSDEDRSKRKSAAEIAAQVRGRIPHPSPGGSGSGSAHSTEAQASSELHGQPTKKSSRIRPTFAAAILDHSRAQIHHDSNPPPPRSSGTNLVGEPAIPETSHSHLVSTTTSEGLSRVSGENEPFAKEQTSVSVV
ncbi:hypothetical protein GGR51DRAFT_496913 [Nemania sp. FL0031]|nr:hypothetical protein GGR51DRAFT_496913 [Nemania sp. FL0031]